MCTELRDKVAELNRLAMLYETAVFSFPAENYLEAFCDFFEVKHRNLDLIDSPAGFRESLAEVSGLDVGNPIADETEELFGSPKRVTVFKNDAALRDELEGPDGLAPFFFVFDLMFCEYDDFTLLFMAGSNN